MTIIPVKYISFLFFIQISILLTYKVKNVKITDFISCETKDLRHNVTKISFNLQWNKM